jgi:energy-coupling factor transporter transmembrane protein EcfT
VIINIPNSFIYEHAYKLILIAAFIVCIFTNNSAYNIGQIFSVSLMCVGGAHFLLRKKSEAALGIGKLLAALIPLFLAISFIFADKSIDKSLADMKQSLEEQKTTFEKGLDAAPPPNTKNNLSGPVTPNQFKQFKAASSKEDMYKQVSELVKLAVQQTQYNAQQQQNLFANFNLDTALAANRLANIESANKLKGIGEQYNLLIQKMRADNIEFNSQYKATFYLIAANYSYEISAFDKSYGESIKNQNAMFELQEQFASELQKIGDILIKGYKNQQIRYDPKQDNLIFLDDGQLVTFNTSIRKIADIAKKEDEVTSRIVNNISKIEDSTKKR